MTGYELPLRAIREQIASAVDLIVHTARLKDGSRKIVNITEVYGIEDDEILTQDIFAFEQTGVRDGKIEGELKPTGIRPTFMGKFKASGDRAAAGRVRHPARGPGATRRRPRGKGRSGAGERAGRSMRPGRRRPRPGGHGRRHGLRLVDRPVDPETGQVVSGAIKEQTRQCLQNLKAQARGGGQLARQGRLGELVAARPGRVRHVQRGVGALVPGRRAGRPGHADAAAAAPRRVPGLDRGHRRGVAVASGSLALGPGRVAGSPRRASARPGPFAAGGRGLMMRP